MCVGRQARRLVASQSLLPPGEQTVLTGEQTVLTGALGSQPLLPASLASCRADSFASCRADSLADVDVHVLKAHWMWMC